MDNKIVYSTVVSTPKGSQFREGDWTCPQCSAHNYQSKTSCFKCRLPKGEVGSGAPRGVGGFLDQIGGLSGSHGSGGGGAGNFRTGDWTCPQCQGHNFQSKMMCFKCNYPRPVEGLPNPAVLGGSSFSSAPAPTNPPPPPQTNPYLQPPIADQTALLSMMMNNQMNMNNLMGMNNLLGQVGMGDLGAGLGGLGALGMGNLGNLGNLGNFGTNLGGTLGGLNMGMGLSGIPGNFRQGDWLCPSCNAHNYRSKGSCFTCHTLKPGGPSGSFAGRVDLPPSFRDGDWMCVASCGNHNYASKTLCKRCNTSKESALAANGGPLGSAGRPPSFREGDWMCHCGNHNYASRTLCGKCQSPKPIAGGVAPWSAEQQAQLEANLKATTSSQKARSRSRSPRNKRDDNNSGRKRSRSSSPR